MCLDFEEVSQTLFLRQDVPEGIKELLDNFQVVLFSHLSEKLTITLLDVLRCQRPAIFFDAVYCSSDPLKNPNDPVCYNQIYFDFEVIQLKLPDLN